MIGLAACRTFVRAILIGYREDKLVKNVEPKMLPSAMLIAGETLI